MGVTEQRQSDRFKLTGSVDVKVIFTRSAEVKTIHANLRDAGLGGICIEAKELLEEGALADLDVALPDGSIANTLGIVRWVKPGEAIGLEFFYETDEARDRLQRALLRQSDRNPPGP